MSNLGRPAPALITGTGCIDVGLAPGRVVTGDVSGQVACFERLSGRRLWSRLFPMPVWGVDCDATNNMVVLALADKQQGVGAGVVLDLSSGRTLLDTPLAAPGWGASIGPEGMALVTTWGDEALLVDVGQKTPRATLVEAAGPCYGVTLTERGFLVASAKQGIVTVDPESGAVSAVTTIANRCYGIDESDGSIVVGSDGNLAAYIVDGSESLHSTTLDNICGVHIAGRCLWLGSLSGALERCRLADLEIAGVPKRRNLGAGVWSIVGDDEGMVVALGSGVAMQIDDESFEDDELWGAGPGGSNMPLVFISYASEDRAIAQALASVCRTAGVIPWLDREMLIPGQDWEHEIRTALKRSSACLVLVSANSVQKRGFVQVELRAVLRLLEFVPPGEIFLIPVVLDDTEPPDPLDKIQWLDLRRESAIDQLRRSLESLHSVSDS